MGVGIWSWGLRRFVLALPGDVYFSVVGGLLGETSHPIISVDSLILLLTVTRWRAHWTYLTPSAVYILVVVN